MGVPETVTERPDAATKPRRFSLWRRFRDDTRGATAVEFAIIALPFLALMGAILESAIVFLASQVLDTATSDAARLIRTGQAQQSSYTASQFKTEVCNRLYVLFTCSKVAVESTVYANFSAISSTPPLDASGNFDPTKVTNFQMGAASQIVVVRVYYAYPLFFNKLGFNLANTANGSRLLAGVAAFRNEPFPW